jgi:hypothetical protein
LSALGAGLGSDFDHVVGFGDDAEIVFDDHDGVALVGQAVGMPMSCSTSAMWSPMVGSSRR